MGLVIYGIVLNLSASLLFMNSGSNITCSSPVGFLTLIYFKLFLSFHYKKIKDNTHIECYLLNNYTSTASLILFPSSSFCNWVPLAGRFITDTSVIGIVIE